MTYSRIVEIDESNRSKFPFWGKAVIVVLLILLSSCVANAEERHDVECLAKNAAYEAGGHGIVAMANVVEVTLNRAGQKSICDVVYEKTANGVCQFSWTCTPIKRELTYREKEVARYIARTALFGGTTYHSDFAENATFFCVPKACRRWHERSSNLRRAGFDGAHVFYEIVS